MSRLHYFYPANDLALAADTEGFTPPKAAAVLTRAGSALPLWYGTAGDRVIDNGIDGRWYDRMVADFGLQTDVYAGHPDSFVPAPWGWSKASRRVFLDMGMNPALLPDDGQLERMRALSHRRTAARLEKAMRGRYGTAFSEPALEVADVAEIEKLLTTGRRMMVKIPWSSSGRGVIDSATVPAAELLRRLGGTVARQGSVMLEPFVSEAVDFALLFDYRQGRAQSVGLSVFAHDSHFGYAGNLVAEEEVLRQHLADRGVRLPVGLAEFTALGLQEIIGDGYSGPLGVDFVANGSTMAVAEINLRMTMGHVAHRLARLLASGVRAKFIIRPNNPTSFNPSQRSYKAPDGHLTAGVLQLVPPSAELAFDLCVI